MDTPLFIPTHVRHFAKGYQDVPGTEITLEKRGPRKWHFTATNDRVHIEYELRVYGKAAKLSLALLVLTVDGKPVEKWPGDTSSALLAFFRDPDGAASPSLGPMPPERPLQEAPRKIQDVYKKFAKKVTERPELQLSLGYADGRWVIGVEGGRISLRANYHLRGGRWEYDQKGLQLLVDNIDCSRATRGVIEEALDYLTGKLTPERAAMSPPIAQASASKRSNAVEVRKATVNRI